MADVAVVVNDAHADVEGVLRTAEVIHGEGHGVVADADVVQRHLHGCLLWHIAWLYAHDGRLLVAVAVIRRTGADAAVVCRVHDAQRKVTVVLAAPAPVDMEQLAAVEAIDDKGMTAAGGAPVVDDGSPRQHLGVDEVGPLRVAVVLAAQLCALHAEDVVQRWCYAALAGTARAVLVVHLYRCAAVGHQLGHGLLLGVGGVGGVAVEHQVPVECRLRLGLNKHLLAVGAPFRVTVIGTDVRHCAHGTVAAVSQRLCHGGGHAAGSAAVTVSVVQEVGAQQVVGGVLVPACGEHRGDGLLHRRQ